MPDRRLLAYRRAMDAAPKPNDVQPPPADWPVWLETIAIVVVIYSFGVIPWLAITGGP